MGRQVDVDDLVGTAEVAERLGLAQYQTVHLWRTRYPDFPEPVVTLKQALVWVWSDVELWARTTGRLVNKAADLRRSRRRCLLTCPLAQ